MQGRPGHQNRGKSVGLGVKVVNIAQGQAALGDMGVILGPTATARVERGGGRQHGRVVARPALDGATDVSRLRPCNQPYRRAGWLAAIIAK